MTLLWVLALAAFATSIISSIIGMGGGLLLLATMLSFLSHAETIPAHGAVQLVSNGTRLLVFLRHIDVKTVVRFVAGALPGSIIGGLLLVWLRKDHIDSTEPYFKIAIGLYVLVTTIRPIAKRPASNCDSITVTLPSWQSHFPRELIPAVSPLKISTPMVGSIWPWQISPRVT